MKNSGFGFFQAITTLLIVSMSVLFIFELTVQNMHANNKLEQSSQQLNEMFSNYELFLSQEQK